MTFRFSFPPFTSNLLRNTEASRSSRGVLQMEVSESVNNGEAAAQPHCPEQGRRSEEATETSGELVTFQLIWFQK